LNLELRTATLPFVPVDISIIVPVFDEEDNVLPLAHEIARALDTTGAQLVQRVENLLPGNRRRRRESRQI